MARYDPALRLRDARARYFEDNGFAADGGYGDRWVKIALGPATLAFPNSQARVRAVRFHDLHHVVTGYETHLVGEAEIGAWEVASGCANMTAAWILNLIAMATGWWIAPRAVARAFRRGRRSENLYRHRYDDALLDSRVGEVIGRLGLDRDVATPRFSDHALFAAWLLVAAVLSLATLALLLVPVGLVVSLVAAAL